jgi:carboxymethylenebutenolidase
LPEIFDQGYLALPANEKPAPAVMVIPAWWGLNSFFKQLCDRLAQAGFVAFAPDLYGGKVAETIEEATALRDGLNSGKTKKLLRGAVGALCDHPRTNGQPIGLVGFSLGAFQSLSLLRDFPDQISAIVVFYGSRGGNYPKARVAVMGHFAETDPYESPNAQKKLEQALKASGAEITLYTYPGTGHWFFESNQPKAYQAKAADLAWERTIGFLKAHLPG